MATFLRCESCGFVFIDRPEWLDEAYAEPINITDTGYVSRNVNCRVRTQMLIELSLNPTGRFLDYASGYGLFVRLMRDLGYDFRWYDPYCKNLFARGFESMFPPQTSIEAVTAFEVFEHLVNPMTEFALLLGISDCLVFTTELVPTPLPRLNEWWYFGLEHGQHVSFYTTESLQCVARIVGCHLISDGQSFHVLSRKPMPAKVLRRMDSVWWRRWISRRRNRVGFSWSDHLQLKGNELQSSISGLQSPKL